MSCRWSFCNRFIKASAAHHLGRATCCSFWLLAASSSGEERQTETESVFETSRLIANAKDHLVLMLDFLKLVPALLLQPLNFPTHVFNFSLQRQRLSACLVSCWTWDGGAPAV